MKNAARYIASFDIGGTKARLGFVDEGGNVLGSERFLLGDLRDPETLSASLAARFRRLAERQAVAWESVCGVGCSITGPLDRAREMVVSSYNLGNWENVPLRNLLQGAFGLPAWIEMDAYAAALGEAWRGAASGAQDVFYLVVGTGIGSGIISEGKAQRGWQGVAGEIGHMTVEPGGLVCDCGNRGCLEIMACGPAIALRARKALAEGRTGLLQEMNHEREITSAEVFEAARRGDALANEIVCQAAGYLGIGLANAVTLLDPQVVVLGGGVMLGGGEMFLQLVRESVCSHCPPWIDLRKTRFTLAALGEEAALIGAARLAWEGLRSNACL